MSQFWSIEVALCTVVALALVPMTSIRVAAEEVALDLTGAWYVLIHYRDADSRDPNLEEWDERVWVFEQQGDRLRWTEYRIVIFKNDKGRFGALSSGRPVRSEGTWIPEEEQLEQIKTGLSVNARGTRVKSLKGDLDGNYRSAGVMQRDSVSVIGFSETWNVSGLTFLPTFRRSDVMESGRSDALAGNTEYVTKKIDRETSVLEGEFDRDGVQRGSFKMVRTGPVTFAKSERSR
jgi:hypothetical protein